MKNKSILFIGLVPGESKESIGGITVFCKNILNFLKNEGINVTFISFRKRFFYGGQLIDFSFSFFPILIKIFKHDIISIHATRDFTVTVAPLYCIFAKLLGKKVVYQAFAGSLYQLFDKLPNFYQKFVLHTVFKSDAVLLETKHHIDYFKAKINANYIWFPNMRNAIKEEFTPTSYEKKFCFISRIVADKGINELVAAFTNLPKEYTLDIYGHIEDNTNLSNLSSNIKYKGILPPEKVIDTLDQYNVLVLPTYHLEGHPGIIIEALSLGKYCISTYSGGIPEIIDNNENGILIKMRDVTAIETAVLNINQGDYSRICQNAYESFNNNFRSDTVMQKLISQYEL